MKIIAIAGTKGKTTIALLLDRVLRKTGFGTVLICSEGTFKNGRLLRNNNYFLKKYKTSATVAAINKLPKNIFMGCDYLIFETSYASLENINRSIIKDKIDICILTNVYWDHVDGRKIKNQRILLERKTGILNNLKKGGSAIIYSSRQGGNISYRGVNMLKRVRPDLNITSYNETMDGMKIPSAYLGKNNIIYYSGKLILNLNLISEKGLQTYPPFKLAILGTTCLLKSLKLSPELIYTLSKKDFLIKGRFNIFKKNSNVIILDNAHEIKSIAAASKFINSHFGGKTTAIVRASYYRSSDYIKKLTEQITPLFNKFIIYDKAISRPEHRKSFTNLHFKRKTGDVAKLMFVVLTKNKKECIIINNEFQAIRRGLSSLKEKEILYIIGDQLEKDRKIIQLYLRKK